MSEEGHVGSLHVFDAMGEELGQAQIVYTEEPGVLHVSLVNELPITVNGHATSYSVRSEPRPPTTGEATKKLRQLLRGETRAEVDRPYPVVLHSGVVRTMDDDEEGGLRLRTAEMHAGDALRIPPFDIPGAIE